MNANMIVNHSEQEPMNKSWNEMLVQQSQRELISGYPKIGPQRLAEKVALESKYSNAEKFPLIHLSSIPFPHPYPTPPKAQASRLSAVCVHFPGFFVVYE